MKILLVDDYKGFRCLMGEVLRSYGHQVVQAESGLDAIRAARELADPPDILLTDIEMPGMGGFELIDCLRTDYPTLRVLSMSSGGYDFPVLPKDHVVSVIVNNPFCIDILLAEVEAAQSREPSDVCWKLCRKEKPGVLSGEGSP